MCEHDDYEEGCSEQCQTCLFVREECLASELHLTKLRHPVVIGTARKTDESDNMYLFYLSRIPQTPEATSASIFGL